jgi:hypothetical protein
MKFSPNILKICRCLFLFKYYSKSNIYPSKHTAKEKIRIAEKTNMLDVLEEEYESLPDDPEMQKEYANIKVRH